MKRNSTRFLALFLTAAMSVTPAVAAFGENQENSDQIPAISLAPQPSEMPEISVSPTVVPEKEALNNAETDKKEAVNESKDSEGEDPQKKDSQEKELEKKDPEKKDPEKKDPEKKETESKDSEKKDTEK